MFSSLRAAVPRAASLIAARSLVAPVATRTVARLTPSIFTRIPTATRSFSTYFGEEEISVAAVTQPAPQFTATAVVNGEFKQVSLSDYKGKWVVLFFYPLDFTFVCPTEIRAFSDRFAEFKALGCEVLACSVDSEYSHLAWINQSRKEGGLGPMNIPVLSDITKDISARYGVLLHNQGISLRGLFIIDPQGILRQVTINDLPIGRSVDETLRLLKAFQFHEKNGEVCPADWKPGQETMQTTASGLKEYFKNKN